MIAIDDRYWLKTRGEMVRPKERAFLFELAQRTAAKFDKPLILNIGVSWGASVHCLFAGAPNATHYAIDIDYNSRPIQHRDLLDVAFIQADSGWWIPTFTTAHLVFVDGDHDYEGVRRDIRNWIPYIPIGGIIAFHDYCPQAQDRERLKGVINAVNEWYKANADDWDSLGVVVSTTAFERVK